MGQALLAMQVEACSMRTPQEVQRTQARPLLVGAPSQHHHPTNIVVCGLWLAEPYEVVSYPIKLGAAGLLKGGESSS